MTILPKQSTDLIQHYQNTHDIFHTTGTNDPKIWGFPGGRVVKNLPANAHRFRSWSKKIPRAMEQLSLCTTTTEPVL